MSRDVRKSDDIRIYVDDIHIASATTMDINRSKSIDKTDVIGSPDKRISEGTIEISGSLTELKSNDLGFKLLRNSTNRNIKTQSTYYDGSGDAELGEAAVQKTINSGTTAVEQEFTALGSRIDAIRLLLKRDTAFTEDLTVTIKTLADVTIGSAITVSNDLIDSDAPFWTEIDLHLNEQITGLTSGNQYKMVLSVSSTSGTLDWYGNEYQPEVLIATTVAPTPSVDLLHSTVDSSTLFVRLDDDYLGQAEGYSFGDGTGTAGDDEINFSPSVPSGVDIYAAYEFDDGVNNPGAWRIVFGDVSSPKYTIRIDEVDADGVRIDSYTINDVKLSSVGRSITPDSFVERTISFEGQSETPINL